MSEPARRIVIVGAGIVGTSIAYYLAQFHAAAVTVFDKATIASGVTRLASGGFRSQFDSPAETTLSIRSRALWEELEAERHIDLGLHRVGYLLLASSATQERRLRERLPFQRELGVEVRELGAQELGSLVPGLFVDDIRAAVFTPADGFAAPAEVASTLARLAQDYGVIYRQEEEVLGVEVKRGRVTAVQTSGGTVACDAIVSAAGLDAPSLGAMVGAQIPVGPRRQHQFVTAPIATMDVTKIPCILDLDSGLFARGDGDGVLLGIANPDEPGSRSPKVDWSLARHLSGVLRHRWPLLAGIATDRAWVGCYEVSPDDRALIGQLDEPDGFYYSNGFSGHGFMHGLAAGEAMAELIHNGVTTHVDLSPFSLERLAAPGTMA